MSAKTDIEWTDATWSPLRVRVKPDAAEIAKAKGYTSLIQIAEKMAGHVGPHCEHVSLGCKLCYSGTNNGRCLPANGTGLPFDRRSRDLVDPFVDEKALLLPLHWKNPRKIFVVNQSDLFGEWVTDAQIDQVFAVMALCPRHTFQVLTKRPERMLKYFGDPIRRGFLVERERERTYNNASKEPVWYQNMDWPLPNVWLGVSVENQATADARIPLLLQTPAAVRFVSYEPALGPVDFFSYMPCTHEPGGCIECREWEVAHGLDWIIAGGESGPGARPANPEWFRSARDQCIEARVPFFFKQHGVWVSVSEVAGKGKHYSFPDGATVRRVGKKAAGALLDGKEWKQFPEVAR
jgi:protein gp37